MKNPVKESIANLREGIALIEADRLYSQGGKKPLLQVLGKA